MQYTLIRPIVNVLGKTQTELNVRDYMTVGDMLAVRALADEKDGYKLSCEMIKRVAGLDHKELEQLDVRDFNRLDLYLAEVQRDPKDVAAEEARKALEQSQTPSNS